MEDDIKIQEREGCVTVGAAFKLLRIMSNVELS
jgi:hypothetical protein